MDRKNRTYVTVCLLCGALLVFAGSVGAIERGARASTIDLPPSHRDTDVWGTPKGPTPTIHLTLTQPAPTGRTAGTQALPTLSPPTLCSTGGDQGTDEVAPSTPTDWQLPNLTPFGKSPEEGEWTPYLQGIDGILAYCTFLEPDAQIKYSPHSVMAVVALKLRATRLHLVLGTIEPIPVTAEPQRSGAIPLSDRQASVLLAAFNGGFKAKDGYFGAMADGILARSPRSGLATIAIYSDGHVQIGAWGTDIIDERNLVAYRQNGKLMVLHSQVTSDTLLREWWGSSSKGDPFIWRSALGLSQDGRTLYYVAGPQIDVATLAKALVRTGAWNALELDVNDYWVHFAAFHRESGALMADPLLPGMNQDVDRYLKSYNRDFFYVTAENRDGIF